MRDLGPKAHRCSGHERRSHGNPDFGNPGAGCLLRLTKHNQSPQGHPRFPRPEPSVLFRFREQESCPGYCQCSGVSRAIAEFPDYPRAESGAAERFTAHPDASTERGRGGLHSLHSRPCQISCAVARGGPALPRAQGGDSGKITSKMRETTEVGIYQVRGRDRRR